MTKFYTLRGTFVPGTQKRLILDDGNFNNGFIVRKFVVAGDPRDSTDEAYATLMLDKDADKVWNWGDNRQIAWAAAHNRATNSVDTPFILVDMDTVVVADMYIGGESNSPYINYYVQLERIELTDNQAVMTLIKERSQDDL